MSVWKIGAEKQGSAVQRGEHLGQDLGKIEKTGGQERNQTAGN